MAGSEQDRIAEQVRERLEGLREQDLTDAEVDAEVRRLLTVGETAIPILLEQLRHEDETLLAVATQALKAPLPCFRVLLWRDRNIVSLSASGGLASWRFKVFFGSG